MSESAINIGLAQPSVSQVIANIEREYGVRLFERLSRRLYLTDDGSYLASYARRILSLYDELDANLGAYAPACGATCGSDDKCGKQHHGGVGLTF